MKERGTVYSGINNIYDIRTDTGESYRCRIKGKILKDDESGYNPLAPGDRVEFEIENEGNGQILSRMGRKNRFARWNKKREAWQIAAANIDFLVVVGSAASPPFRPRFIDRVLIAAKQGNVQPVILVNKVDLGLEPWVRERLDVWRGLGYLVLCSSAETQEGLVELRDRLQGKQSALFGPSGVGKSSLLNILAPGHDLITGVISKKHDRGRHVTNFGRMLDMPGGGRLIDTPGVREVLVREIIPEDLYQWFEEMLPFARDCSFQPCSHRHEPDCAVRKAVDSQDIHSDRYENYLRIFDELQDSKTWN